MPTAIGWNKLFLPALQHLLPKNRLRPTYEIGFGVGNASSGVRVRGKKTAIVLFVALASAIFFHRVAHWNAATNTNSAITSAKLQIPAQTFRAGRQVFPYSIIPGGVRSGKELEASIATDPVAAKHYAGINPQRLLLERLKRDMDLFASYRIGNNVYWTSHALRIRAGELVLTDGVHLIRARCGNRLVRIPPLPQAPTLPVDPPTIAFEAGIPPVAPPLESPPLVAQSYPQLSIDSAPVPPVSSPPGPGNTGTYPSPAILPPSGCCVKTPTELPPSVPPVASPPVTSPPLSPVPEPSSFALFVTGLGAAGYAMRRLRRR